ncbi:hypothetical protein N431DRAFT_490327 [Stipitochalara longipes BDJ]|nr:hypothetical protein N431DRAFT_490327 [Stipitochalara longipes BDJ]
MVSKSTHVYKTVGSLEILIDVYLTDADVSSNRYTVSTPVVLYFHGGGLVAHDRRQLAPHIVQLCLMRGWPLVSPDYRLFPQASGLEMLEDIKDAYSFVLEKLPSILGSGTGLMKNVIVAGSSAGAYLTYQAGHHFSPRPLALLTYYGHATIDDDFYRSNTTLMNPPITLEQVEHFLKEPVHCGFSPPSNQFDPNCLLEDLSPNSSWKRPEREGGSLPRDVLFVYLNQINRYPEMAKGLDTPINDPGWKNFTPTIVVQGDADPVISLKHSENMGSIIGPTPPKRFVVPGAGHGFDMTLFVGDPGLVIVEDAWKALDEVVKERATKYISDSMDPLTALSVAGTIVQFIDFGSKLLKEGRGLYRSSTGALNANQKLELTIADLQAVVKKLREIFASDASTKPLTKSQDADECLLERICHGAIQVANELLEKLSELKLKGNKGRKWESFQQAVKYVWSREEIADMMKRLANFREALNSRVLISLRHQIDVQSLNTSARFDSLDEQTQFIISSLLEQNKTILLEFDSSTARVREQNSVFMQTVSQMLCRLKHSNQDAHLRTRTMILDELIRDKMIHEEPEIFTTFEMLNVSDDRESTIRTSVQAKVLQCLYYLTMTNRYQDLILAYPKTFEWIFHNASIENLPWSNFVDWLQTGSGLYWINGKAGSGKSTLMKHIVDAEQTHRYLRIWAGESPICFLTFFFWNSGLSEQKTQQGLLRSLVFQILDEYPELIPLALPDLWSKTYSDTINGGFKLPTEMWSWSNIQLMFALKVLVAQLRIPLKLFFAIDGLDEFEGDHNDVVELFDELAAAPNVKICISSRPWVLFQRRFSKEPQLRLQDLTYKDIELFVSGKLGANKEFQFLAAESPNDVEPLIYEIVKRANGVFLWVRLVVKSLLTGIQNRDDFSMLQRRLQLLPSELEPLYKHFLTRIESVYLSWASKAFQIVHCWQSIRNPPFGSVVLIAKEDELHGGLRPLTLKSFTFAISEDFNLSCARELSAKDFATRCRDTEIHVAARCGGLIEVSHSTYDGQAQSTVRYLHSTVREFLEREEYWMRFLQYAINYNPYVMLMKSCVLELEFNFIRHPIPYGGKKVKRITMKKGVEDLVVSCMIYANYIEVQNKGVEEGFVILDYLDAVVIQHANPHQRLHWSNTLRFTKDLRLSNFKEFASLYNLTAFLTARLLPSEFATSYVLNRYIKGGSVVWTKNGLLPYPSAKLVSFLLKIGADPTMRILGESTFETALLRWLQHEEARQTHTANSNEYLTIIEKMVNGGAVGDVAIVASSRYMTAQLSKKESKLILCVPASPVWFFAAQELEKMFSVK